VASAKEIDKILPQTQCGECGYAGCRPYAEALAQGSAPIDRCPPGGLNTLRALASLLSVDPVPYEQSVKENTRTSSLAVIREAECVGCTKCIQACPVDAIVGSANLMHSVIAHECTGCGLCVEPCPVDCIDIMPQESNDYDTTLARARFHAKSVRQLREKQAKEQAYQQKRTLAASREDKKQDKLAKQDFILQALARSKAKQKT